MFCTCIAGGFFPPTPVFTAHLCPDPKVENDSINALLARRAEMEALGVDGAQELCELGLVKLVCFGYQKCVVYTGLSCL